MFCSLIVFKFIQSDTTSLPLIFYAVRKYYCRKSVDSTLLGIPLSQAFDSEKTNPTISLFRLEFLQNCHFLNVPTICFVNICNDIYPVPSSFSQSTLKNLFISISKYSFLSRLAAFGIALSSLRYLIQ